MIEVKRKVYINESTIGVIENLDWIKQACGN